MKKHFISLIIIILILSTINISYADTDNMLLGTYTFLLDDLTATNLDTDNDTTYVLITGITVDNASVDSDSGFSSLEFVIDLGIDLDEYTVKDIYAYNPSNFDFDNSNVYRPITKYSKTQKEYNNFYYNPVYSDPNYLWGFQGEVAETYLHGFFNAGFKPEYETYNLDTMFKMPDGRERVLEAFPIKYEKAQNFFKDIMAKKSTDLKETNISRLYTQSVIFELEKKSTELPVPKGDFIKALNEFEFTLQSHKILVGDHIYIHSNLVDSYNKDFLNPQWSESYNDEGGIVKFTGILPKTRGKYDPLTRLAGKEEDINVEVYFTVPYSKEEGYVYFTNEYTANTRKMAWVSKFIADGKEAEYIEEEIFYLDYVEITNEYFHNYEPDTLEKIK